MLALFEHVWVLSRTPLNETQLDIEYDRLEDGSNRSVGEIRSTFRYARSRGQVFPDEVLRRLEADPVMSGLAKHVSSVFWELLENPPVTRGPARVLVDKSLGGLGGRRTIGGQDSEKIHVGSSPGGSNFIDMENCRQGTNGMVKQLIETHPNSLDLIALLGALSREAWFCFQAEEAEYFGTQFWILLQDFLSQPGMERLEGVLDEYAVDRVVYWRDESKCGDAWLLDGKETMPDNCWSEEALPSTHQA
jgi:hypothetical protein